MYLFIPKELVVLKIYEIKVDIAFISSFKNFIGKEKQQQQQQRNHKQIFANDDVVNFENIKKEQREKAKNKRNTADET